MRPSPVARATARRLVPPKAAVFRWLLPVATRWTDNDQYGHLNNAKYIELIDTAINTLLINHAGLIPHPTNPHPSSKPPGPIGLIVHSQLSYAAPVAFPQPVLAALSVASLGRTSVTWRVAIFGIPHGTRLAGQGTFVGPGQGARLGGLAPAEAEEVGGTAAAWGTVTHVFVDRNEQRRSVVVGEGLRRLVEERMVVGDEEEGVAASWVPTESRGSEGKRGGGEAGAVEAKL